MTKWRRWLVVYAFALASLFTLTLGVVLVSLDRKLSSGDIMSAIGLNLIASVVFAVFFVAISGRVQDRAIRENVEQHFVELRGALIPHLTRHDEGFLPMAAYPPTGPDDFGAEYNMDLTESLLRTNTATFYGRTGWSLPARLTTLTNRQFTVRLAIIDPASAAFDRHVRDAQRSAWGRDRTLDEIYDELEMGFLHMFVALFDCRHDHTITILLHEDLSTYRYVLTDDALYISWLQTGGKSVDQHMPMSHKFHRTALLHTTLSQESERRFQLTEEFGIFRDSDPEAKLYTAVDNLRRRFNGRRHEHGQPLRPPVLDADLVEWREQYRRDTAPFVASLGDLPDASHGL